MTPRLIATVASTSSPAQKRSAGVSSRRSAGGWLASKKYQKAARPKPTDGQASPGSRSRRARATNTSASVASTNAAITVAPMGASDGESVATAFMAGGVTRARAGG